jgi:hypothetical protein
MDFKICFALITAITQVILAADDFHANYQGCNVDKGCFGAPGNCLTTGNCLGFVSWSYLACSKKVELLIHGLSDNSNDYLAVALSDDNTMGEDLVFHCVTGSPNAPRPGSVGTQDAAIYKVLLEFK